MRSDRSIGAFAVDVDGTLLDRSFRVTRRVRSSVERLRRHGVSVVLATSRYPAAVRAVQEELGILGEYFVACQGAVVARYAGARLDVISETLMDVPSAVALTDAARRLGLGVSYYRATSWRAEPGHAMVDEEAAIVGCLPQIVPRLDARLDPPSKMTLMVGQGALIGVPEVLTIVPEVLTASESDPGYVEVVAAGISKWSGFAQTLEMMGIDVERTAAIGDGSNDLEMISQAPLGIAMGHAPASVHAAATWTVPSNDSDGFANAVEQMFDRGLLR